MLTRLRALFHQTSKVPSKARGIISFAHTGDVIAAQRIFEKSALQTMVKGPPPAMQTGCDMVIEFALVEILHVQRILEQNSILPLEVTAIDTELLEPVSLYHVKDFGAWLMVRAANMKITIHKETLTIVNISGGGCPDVPYLAEMLTGKHLHKAPDPQQFGQTLCGYALHLALKEMIRLCPG